MGKEGTPLVSLGTPTDRPPEGAGLPSPGTASPGGLLPGSPRLTAPTGDTAPDTNSRPGVTGEMAGVPPTSGVPGGTRPDSPTRVGVTPSTAIPPIPVDGKTNPTQAVQLLEPKVISFTEEKYSCGPGETFATISKQKYGTDKYAQALMLFNRNHPLGGDEALPDSGALKPQQKVYIPPLEVLENRYPGGVKDLSPSPPPAVVPSSGLAPSPPAGVPAEKSLPGPAPAALRTYRVEGNGETMRQIATKLWGKPDFWTAIYELNQGWRPEYPLPAGTLLKVPSSPVNP